MEGTIIGEFATRREAELAVDHLVQECGVPRSDVFVQPVGRANSARTHAAAADVKVAPWQEGQQKLDGALEASVDFHGDDPKKVADVLHSTGAKAVRTK